MHTIKSDSENASANQPDSEQAQLIQDDWAFFHRIFCISLINREDRRKQAMEQFERVGLARRVEFFLVEKHPTDCEEGIYTSHLNCMSKALASGAENILIFEDDVVFERFSPRTLRQAAAYLRQTDDWHIFFLGCLVKKSRKTTNSSIVQIRYGALTHAYAIHHKFAQHLVANHPWNKVAYDDFLRDLNSPSMYAIYPSCAFQSDASSDNDPHLPLDRFRRLCGGLQNIQKWNERYHRHKFFIICCHVLALIALFIWL
jgi:GR25 family glycosyltransferase involved in LPS biosynthesis